MENWDPHGIEGPNEKGFYGRRCHKWNRRAFMQWGLLWIKGALMGERSPIDKICLHGEEAPTGNSRSSVIWPAVPTAPLVFI